MSWIVWAVIGILAVNVILISGMLIEYKREQRERKK